MRNRDQRTAQIVHRRAAHRPNLGAGLPQSGHRRLEHASHIVFDGIRRIIEPHRQSQLGQGLCARGRKFESPRRARWPSAPARTSSANSRSSTSRAIGPMTPRSVSASAPGARRKVTALRNDAPARFVTADPAPVRRHPYRSRDVTAEFEGRQAGGERRPRPRRMNPGGARRVPRVIGGTEDRIEGLPIPRQCRGVGLAEDHRACAAQPSNGLGIALGHMVPASRPQVVRMPAVSYVSLIVIGTPCSGPMTSPRASAASASSAARRAPVGIERDNGIERRVQPFDARQDSAQAARG